MLLVSDDSLPLVHAQFRYRSVDPFAVQLRVSVVRFQAISWTFSRDLLIAGTSRPSGIGDVRIYPGGDGLLIEYDQPPTRTPSCSPIAYTSHNSWVTRCPSCRSDRRSSITTSTPT